uniref:Uncharacterized protein n=1 Tax=uncultured organism TaxID=155900 RepID=A0A7L9QD00_9ZZZZ|nr:hypothetical protein [uncultured organism]
MSNPYVELEREKLRIEGWLAEITYKTGFSFHVDSFGEFLSLSVRIRATDIDPLTEAVVVDNVAFGWFGDNTVMPGREFFMMRVRDGLREIEYRRIHRHMFALGVPVYEIDGKYRQGAIA